MNKKIAIVLSGGGMTCSYTAGFLKALADKYQFTNPDYIVASSGSAGAASYFTAGQYESVTNIWANLLSTKDFIDDLRVGKIIDIDYLIDTVFKKQDPLKVQNLKASKINLLVPATNAESAEVDYFSNRDVVDWFEVLRATKAMPILYNKTVGINEKEYCDSRLTASVDLNIIKAIELGAKKIIVVSTNEHAAIFEKLGYDLWVDARSDIFKKNHRALSKKISRFKIPKDIEIIKVSPSGKSIPRGLENDKNKLCHSIELGYKDCANNAQIASMLNMQT
jgi:predicted patatin/cPLA2 family phospholipase